MVQDPPDRRPIKRMNSNQLECRNEVIQCIIDSVTSGPFISKFRQRVKAMVLQSRVVQFWKKKEDTEENTKR